MFNWFYLFKYHSDIAKTGDKSSLNTLPFFVLILQPEFSCHLHESCYTQYIWRVNVHDICFVRFGIGVPELCPFLKLLYPYRKSLYQFSSHLYDFSWFFLWQSWVIVLYLTNVMVNIYSIINISILHVQVVDTGLYLQIITITV